MSSWKQYGGINNFEKFNKINTGTVSLNNLILKEPFQGNFDICGEIQVAGNAIFNNMDINGTSTFNGKAVFNSEFSTKGNIISNGNINVSKDIILGDTLYFDNKKSQFIYGNSSGLGINTHDPKSALDISTNLVKGFNIISWNSENVNTLAQNNVGKGLQLGVDANSTYIHFFNDHTIASGIVDGNIEYSKGGNLTLDVSQNINVLASVSISNRNKTLHVNNETAVIYDTSNGIYFGNIYNNPLVNTGSALSLIATDNSSNTFMYISTPDKKGLGIGGGAYPNNTKNSMGTIGTMDTSGQYTPSQTIISGNDKVKYKTTTGINTFAPKINNYVLDINGPVRIDNGDITNVTGNVDFELYSLSYPINNNNSANALALGSAYSINPNDNKRILKTVNYGSSWNTIDVSTNLVNMDAFTSIHMYDQNNCFMSGYNNYLSYSYNGGYTWRKFNSQSVEIGVNYNHIFVNKQPKVNGNVLCYFSADISSTLFTFEMPLYPYTGFNDFSANFIIQPIQCSNNLYIDKINSIVVNDKSVYLAGNTILKYNATNTILPQSNSPNKIHYYLSYSYNEIKAFDNSFAIAVGNNIISSTLDGGTTWNDVVTGVNLNSVHIYDFSNAVAVGSQGNIWITNNSGSTWNYMPNSLLNASGKDALITSTNNNFKNVMMPDRNTIIITNTIQPYVKNLQKGISNIYNIFVPNFVNRENNVVIDISGIVNISGDLKINDNGAITSTNSTFHLLNKNVQTINIGGNAESINIGNTLIGNTNIQNNMVVYGSVKFSQKMIVADDISMNANVYIKGNAVFDAQSQYNNGIFVNKSNVVVTGNILGNIYPIGDALNIGGANNDISIGGVTNTTREQNIYIGQYGAVTSAYTPSKIYIGGTNDYVYLRGNTTILQQVQQSITASTILVNNIGTGANATAGGAGIDIFDNSYSIAVTKNVFGYMHVGKDLQSFVFKAPSYGAYDSSGNPAPNTYNNLQLISPENRLRLGVNEMKLSTNQYSSTSGNVRSGLVVLQTNSDFITSQGSHSYYNDAQADADYAINISNAFDISNIMLKLFDTVAGSQTIDSNVMIGNTIQPYQLYVFGNANVYGNTVMPNVAVTNSFVANGNIFLTGNILLTGNIGIGTTTPQLTLDVSGNVRFIGKMINTNYDNLQFPNNYSNKWFDNLNKATSNSYYQDIVASYDGQYQYAFLYNKYSNNSLIKSNNFGKSWVSIPLTQITGNVAINQAVPYMTNNTTIFTPITLASAIGESFAAPLNIQIGKYIASGSSYSGSNYYYNVFDNNPSTYWLSSPQYQSIANPIYNSYYGSINYYGGASTSYINSISGYKNPIPGEYIQINLPFSFVLNNFAITNDGTNSSVREMIILGSTNGTNWYWLSSGDPALSNNFPIGQFGTITYNTNYLNQIPYSTNAYSYFRFVTIQTWNYPDGSGTLGVSIKNLVLKGTVQNATGSYAAAIACSGNGQIITIANQEYNSNCGNLYVSDNYGSSFKDTNVQARGNGIWQSVALSQIGKYQYATVSSTLGQGNIWKSADYGLSWRDTLFGTQNGFQSINVSANGQYITAIQSGNVTNTNGNIWVSNDYGTTWNSWQQIYSYVPFNNGFLNQGSVDFNKTIAISTSGQYQTALGLSSTVNGGGANIWYNNNYGQGVWIDTEYSAPVINGTVSVLSSVSMTGTGQYQTVSFIGGISNSASTVFGNVLKSVDYGVSWKDCNFKVPSTKNNNNTTVYGYLPKIVSSVNGQYVIGISKYESVRDLSYNNNNATQSVNGNIFASVIPANSDMNTTLYFGSPYTGNVFQPHGFQLNVPIDNNSSLMMGYDTGLDSAYINSADQYGYNSLCLNAAGGAAVGIARIDPDPKYALDISGIVNISNDKGLLVIQGNSGNNIGIGLSVFSSLTSGSKNTAIGYNGLTSLTSGSNNTAIGYNAFANGSFNNSTAVGCNAQPTQDNQIVLGTAAEVVYIPSSQSATSFASGALQVSGGVGIGGNIFVGGKANIVNDASFAGIVAVGNTTSSTSVTSGALQVTGGVGIGGNIFVGGRANITNDASFVGIVAIGNTTSSNTVSSGALQVTGGVGIGGNIFVGGRANITNDASFVGIVAVGNTMSSISKTTGALQVAGGVGIGGNIFVGGRANIASDVSFVGIVAIGNTTSSTSVTSGALQVTGGVGIGGNIFVGGRANIANDASFVGIVAVGNTTSSNTVSSGALQVTGGVGIGGNIFVGGRANIANDASFVGIVAIGNTMSSISQTTGALQVSGGVGIGGNIFVGYKSKFVNDVSVNGIMNITNTTVSTTYSTGALLVAGGVGIGGKLNVNSDASFNGIVRCLDRLYIGRNDPGGGGYDTAYLEYAAISGENTTLRLVVANDTTDHINLNPSGSVGIGTDSPAYKLDVQGTIRATGQITGLSFNASSDYRLKNNICVLSKNIDLLKPVEYDLSGGKHDMGFLAHEVQEIFPFLVNGEKDGVNYQCINYNGFIALLVKEVQELKKENAILHDKNQQFENRLKKLEERVLNS